MKTSKWFWENCEKLPEILYICLLASVNYYYVQSVINLKFISIMKEKKWCWTCRRWYAIAIYLFFRCFPSFLLLLLLRCCCFSHRLAQVAKIVHPEMCAISLSVCVSLVCCVFFFIIVHLYSSPGLNTIVSGIKAVTKSRWCRSLRCLFSAQKRKEIDNDDNNVFYFKIGAIRYRKCVHKWFLAVLSTNNSINRDFASMI